MAMVRRENDPARGHVVVKEATEPAARARLAREAAVLERARHPGVVALVRYDDDEHGRAILVTRDAGGRTVTDLADLTGDQAAALGAALAQTLADLHRSGVSHGAVRPEHVVVTDAGHPVLCGLADAGLVDPPEGQSGGFDPTGDVGALADVLASVLEPAEGLRRWSGGVAGLLRRADERSMEQLAGELAAMAGPLRPPLRVSATTAPDAAAPAGDGVSGHCEPAPARATPAPAPNATPSAGATIWMDDRPWADDPHVEHHPFWADPPGSAASSPGLGDPSATDALFAPLRDFGPRPPQPRPVGAGRWSGRRLAATVALALLAVAAGATTVAALGGAGGAPMADRPTAPPGVVVDGAGAPGPGAEDSIATASPAIGAPPTSTASATAPCPTTHDEAALVGVPATCADRLATVGNQVSLGPLRWVVGAEGDVAVAGDFDCDGWLEVASLGVAGGDVAVFDGWAGGGHEPTGRILQRVAGADGVAATPRDRCHDLVVRRAGNEPVTIPTGPAS